MSINKVLLFRHNDVCGNLLNTLTDFVAVELNRRSIGYEFIDITRPQQIVFDELYDIVDDSFDAAIMFNDPGWHNAFAEEGNNLFDKYDILFFNWIVDHPICQLHYLVSECKNYNIICLDRCHVAFVKKICPDIKSVSFLPLAGIEDKDKFVKPILERKYDVAFPASVQTETLGEALKVYKNMPFPNNEIILNLIDYLMENRSIDVTIALDIVFKDRFGIDHLDDDEYKIALQLAEQANNFMRNYLREEVMHYLMNSDINVHVFGNGWENRFDNETGSIVYHEGVSFIDSEPIFGNCKILLNIMPCFKDGFHDRIASGMLHRAVVMTDHSRYLDGMPEGIMDFYDINNLKELPEKLCELLANTDSTQKMADAGYEFAMEHFTWEKTVGELIGIIEKVKSNN